MRLGTSYAPPGEIASRVILIIGAGAHHVPIGDVVNPLIVQALMGHHLLGCLVIRLLQLVQGYTI